MKRAIAFIGACLLAVAPLAARAQSAPGVTTPFTFTAVNQQVTIALNGQTWCSVAVASVGGGATLVPSVSTDGVAYSTVSGVGGGSIAAVGTYSGNVTGLGVNTFRLQATALTSGTASGTITCTTAAGGQPSGFGSNGAALLPVCDQSVAVNISSATTTQLVGLVANKTVWPCNFDATIAGTTPTLLFEYGTGSSCGTGTTALSGTYAFTAGAFVNIGGALGIFARLPVGNALCVVSGGTTPTVQGILTYAIY